MSLEKIIKEAIDKNPMEMKDAFAEEMQTRIALALEEKYKKAMEAKDSDEDDDDDDDDADEDEDDDEDEDEDDKPAFLKKKNEEVEETSDETLEEGPFKGVGKMLMKRKLNKASKGLSKAQADNTDAKSRDDADPSVFAGAAANRKYDKLSGKGNDILAKRHRIQKATDRLNRPKPNDYKIPFNDR